MSGGGDYDTSPNNAILVDKWFLFGNVKVLQIGVSDSNLLLAPMVTESLKVSIVIVVAVFFEVYHRPFLLLFFVHWDKDKKVLPKLKICTP